MSGASRPRVAIQGVRGAFSDEAAARLLGEEIEVVPCETFDSLYQALDDGRADFLLAPVENSLVGSVQRSQDLLMNSSLSIVGEVIIPIVHCLIGVPGATLEGIEVVQSHPVALAQCERFFAANPQIRRVTADDTAGSVMEIMERGDRARAAIAARRAAETYDAVVLREHLEDHRENYTRFLLLGREPFQGANANKLSLITQLRHEPGALVRALEPFSRREINLLKIESRPIPGRPWEYRFHLDLEGSLDDARVSDALEELRERTAEVHVLGNYPASPTAWAGGDTGRT